MEESAKRRERLKRSYAGLQDYPAPPSNVGSATMQFPPSHRGSWNPPMAPPPPHYHSNYAHNQRMAPPPHEFHSNIYAHNQRMYPLQAPPYYSGPRGYPNQPNCFQPNPAYPNPGFRPMGRPMFAPEQVRAIWSSPSPGPNSGRGRGSYPSHRPGRGRAHQFAGRGMNPVPRRGNPPRRGPPGPERLYHKSMLEDPWKDLKPVIWESPDPKAGSSRATESPQSWLPKSISSNTTSVAEGSNKSRSGPSLAESLAASLYETVHETGEIEQGTLEQ